MNSTITSNKGTPAPNSTYPKGGVSCSTDSFVVNQTLVFQINFCGKRPALRVAAKRQAVKKPHFSIISLKINDTTIQIKPSEKALFLGYKFHWIKIVRCIQL